MGTPISSLPTASSLTGAELFPVVQDGQTKHATTDAIPYIPAGANAVTTTVKAALDESVSVFRFMTAVQIADVQAGTALVDVTAALQAAVTASASSGREIHIPSGVYKITAPIVKASSFNCPNIRGDGANTTVFKAVGFTSGTTGKSILNLVGGSGAFANAVISGITFTSDNGNATGTEVNGQCGVKYRDCAFGNLKIGGLLHNRDSGSFTEYVVFDDCDFSASCVEPLVYQRTGGNDSFHGSGLRDCTINESASATLPKIRIGGTGSTSNDIIVYNAPLSFQIWKNTTTAVLVNNTTRYSTNFHGNVTLELFGTAAAGKWKFCNDSRSTYLLGTISSLQDVTQRGTLVLCDTFEAKSDGTVNALLKPYRIEAISMASGANTIATLPGTTTETYLVKLRFADSSGPARKVYLLAVNLDATGVHTVTTIAQLEDYFGGSMPYPSFTMSGQNLVATAAFATTVSCTGTVTKIGIGEAFSL